MTKILQQVIYPVPGRTGFTWTLDSVVNTINLGLVYTLEKNRQALELGLSDGTKDLTVNSVTANYFYGGTYGFSLLDSGTAFYLSLLSDSTTAFTADRTLTLDTDNASRILKITGNPTIADWFDQSVKTTATPTFASVILPTGGYIGINGGVRIGIDGPGSELDMFAALDMNSNDINHAGNIHLDAGELYADHINEQTAGHNIVIDNTVAAGLNSIKFLWGDYVVANYPRALAIFAAGATTYALAPSFYGLVAEGKGDNTYPGVGLFGIGSVGASADAADCFGGQFMARAVHAGGTNYGIWASAALGATNWAGYFDGNVKITSNLTMGAGASVDEFSTDGTMAGNSDTALPTEKAVKSYADGKIPKVALTDHAVPRANGTDGTLQNSGVILDDSNNIAVNSIKAGGAENVKLWSYSHTITAGEDAANSADITVTAVTLAKVRLLLATMLDGGALVYSTFEGGASWGFRAYLTSTTNCTVSFGTGYVAGDVINLLIVEAI